MTACLRIFGSLALMRIAAAGYPAKARPIERGQWMVMIPEVGDFTLSLWTYQEKREDTAWWLFADRRFTRSEEDGAGEQTFHRVDPRAPRFGGFLNELYSV